MRWSRFTHRDYFRLIQTVDQTCWTVLFARVYLAETRAPSPSYLLNFLHLFVSCVAWIMSLDYDIATVVDPFSLG